jgi:hypothetical protein
MNQKVVKKRAQVLVFDDFNKSPFDQNNTMAISLFNLMFDWSLSHISVSIKQYSCVLHAKAPIYLISHHGLGF